MERRCSAPATRRAAVNHRGALCLKRYSMPLRHRPYGVLPHETDNQKNHAHNRGVGRSLPGSAIVHFHFDISYLYLGQQPLLSFQTA